MSDNANGGAPAGNEGGAPATPATPAAEPAKQPVATPAEPAQPTEQPSAYVPATGNKSLDVALVQLSKSLGLSPDSPELVEFRNGNPKYLEGAAALAGKRDELAPFFELGNEGVKALAEGAKASEAKLREEVEGYAGGKETLDKALAFVRSGSTQEQMEEIAGALDQGGLVARAMVTLMLQQMNGSPSVTVEGAEAVKPGAAAAAPDVGPKKYESKEAWRAAQRELISKHGYGYAETDEYKALVAAFPR